MSEYVKPPDEVKSPSKDSEATEEPPSTPVTPTGPSTPQPYRSFFLTPGGTIVSTTGRPIKPETDPDWEARRAAHKAKRQRHE